MGPTLAYRARWHTISVAVLLLLGCAPDRATPPAPALRAAEGAPVEVEGMAYRSSNGPILVVYGGLAYVRGLPDWDAATVRSTVVVRGTVRHPPLPPDAPPAGGSWVIEATGFAPVQGP